MPEVNLYACTGKRGQMGFKGMIPFQRADYEMVLRPFGVDSIFVVGRSSKKYFEALKGFHIFPFTQSHDPHTVISNIRSRYYDRHVWVLGGPTTLKAFAPLVTGQILHSTVQYDGPADAWLPFKELGLKGFDDGKQRAGTGSPRQVDAHAH